MRRPWPTRDCRAIGRRGRRRRRRRRRRRKKKKHYSINH
jgi:hypothetical protein